MLSCEAFIVTLKGSLSLSFFVILSIGLIDLTFFALPVSKSLYFPLPETSSCVCKIEVRVVLL